METVKKFCNKAILINEGKLLEVGNPRKVTRRYSELNQAEIDRNVASENSQLQNSNLHIRVLGPNDQTQQTFKLGDTMTAAVNWEDIENLESVGVNIFKESGEHITGFNTNNSGLKNIQKDKKFKIEFTLNITPGKYYLLVEAYKKSGQLADSILDGPRFSVIANDNLTWSGLTPLEHKWKNS